MNRNLEELVNQIAKGTIRIRISWKYTVITVIGSVLLVFIGLPLIILSIENPTNQQSNLIVALIVGIALAVFVVLQIVYISDAYIKGTELIFKRVFQKEEIIKLEQIKNTSEFTIKNTRYTIVKYLTSQSELKTRLIVNSRSLIFGNELSANQIISIAKNSSNR